MTQSLILILSFLFAASLSLSVRGAEVVNTKGIPKPEHTGDKVVLSLSKEVTTIKGIDFSNERFTVKNSFVYAEWRYQDGMLIIEFPDASPIIFRLEPEVSDSATNISKLYISFTGGAQTTFYSYWEIVDDTGANIVYSQYFEQVAANQTIITVEKYSTGLIYLGGETARVEWRQVLEEK